METSSNNPASCHRLAFGPFSLLPLQRALLRDREPIRLGARAFDILVALVERPGEPISRDALIAQVWPNTFVEAVNLRVHIAALRRALGDTEGRLIRTHSGRGYQLTVPVVRVAETLPPVATSAVLDLPVAVTRLIGRSQFIDEVVALLPRRRLMSIVGPGGIGKTRVAVACAQVLARSYRDGVGFLDLTKIAEPDAVAPALAVSLGVDDGPDALQNVIAHLRGRAMLLVIDNCEHVIDAAACLVDAISAAAPQVHILATSREALRAQREWVSVLPPLASPPEAEAISAEAALAYPAVDLFVEHASAAQFGYWLSDAEAPVVADICRRLDGVALAIELAAAQLGAIGVRWLADHLDDRLWLLGRGRRTAVARHQNLAALLDWSYRLLSEREQATLRRMAAFPGGCTLAEAVGLETKDGIRDPEVIEAVGGLVAKSLATLDASGSITRYRLGETTRAYVSGKLAGVTGDDRFSSMRALIPNHADLVDSGVTIS